MSGNENKANGNPCEISSIERVTRKFTLLSCKTTAKKCTTKKCVWGFFVVVVATRPNNFFFAVLVAGTVWLIWSCPLMHPHARPGTFKTNMDEK